MHGDGGSCILLFSGGRDSTIAAVRLSKNFPKLILATVTTDHLVGINSVRQRLAELKKHLPSNTEWFHIIPQQGQPVPSELKELTCLPCHQVYVAVGAILAKRFGAESIAFGYAGYQSSWPEQTTKAIERLSFVLKAQGLRLILPTYDVMTKEAIQSELTRYQLSSDALEQKCLKQQFNIELKPDHLSIEIDVWEKGLAKILGKLDTLSIEVVTALKREEF
jgi:hypothetical protein